MRGLILNRNKYIVEKTKYFSTIRYASIFATILVVIGLTFLFNANNIRGTSNDAEGHISEKEQYEYVETQKENDASLNQKGTETVELKNENIAEKDEQLLIVNNSIQENYFVTKVVDGDTIYVSGIKTRIRLIGVNTPETVSSSKPIECFGPEASNYLESLLLNKYVGLESDAAAGDLDGYGRPLRYVYYNGENINQKLILEGYGKEASYGSEYKYRTQFVESEKSAIANNKGLWSPDTCNGLE